MNIEACYNKMGADYAEVKSRLPSDAFIKRFERNDRKYSNNRLF